jgi:hypothetical protein
MRDIDTTSFASRMYEQLDPSAKLDLPDSKGRKHLWILCCAIGSMFDQVEDITTLRPDDLSGWADMVDVNRARVDWLEYVGMLVGVRLQTTTDIYSGAGPQLGEGGDLALTTPDQQRDWIRQRRRQARARPAALIQEVQYTLTGRQLVLLRERVNTPWHWVIITVSSETPDPASTEFVILSHKPAPDTFEHLTIETMLWFRVNELYDSYATVRSTYASYQDLNFAEFQ